MVPDRCELRTTETRIGILFQLKLIGRLEPGTPDHERATKVLLLLQDGLHVLTEFERMANGLNAASSGT